jgi:proton-translocating NADH-quinone oxidoreductase chain M
MIDSGNIFSILFVLILVIPVLSIFFIALLPEDKPNLIWNWALVLSSFIFFLSSILWLAYSYNNGISANFLEKDLIQGVFLIIPLFNINQGWDLFLEIQPFIAIDGVSILLIELTTFLIPVCFLTSISSIKSKVKEYIILFFMIELLCICTFTFLDLFLFYIFFESVLIPMFVIVGIWGSRSRKIRAAYQFFLYTLLGSIFMFFALLYIKSVLGTTNYIVLLNLMPLIDESTQLLLWLSFFCAFAVKVPMIPFHLWLPEAHVEAPTAGSVILAGILLKLGTYGFLRFSVPLFPVPSFFFMPFIFLLCSIGSIYASLTTLRQVDLKKIIAYSSVAHMSVVMVGLFALTPQGLQGSLSLMLGHGIVSSALFLCVGVLYDRYHTRIVKYYGGLMQVMPNFSLFFLFFTLANIGFPGLCNFVGEFLCFLGAFERNAVASFFCLMGTLGGVGYSMWLANRLVFGQLRAYYISTFTDLSLLEYFMFLPFIFLTLVLGVYPSIILDTADPAIFDLSIKLKVI